MRKIKLLIAVAVVTLMCGCSHQPEQIATTGFEVPLDNNKVASIAIPASWELKECDGFSYWQFNDDTVIYRTKSLIPTGDKKGNCYYSSSSVQRDFGDYAITVKTSKKNVDTVGNLLDGATVFERNVVQYKEAALESLPEYKDYPMDLTDNGLYMPLEYTDVEFDIYTASHTVNGTNFLLCWIMNYKLEDLKPVLNNLVTCNSGSGKLSSWYESSDVYYAESGRLVVCAKKLTYNTWCCYLATDGDYADYAVKAMHYVTFAE